MIDLVRRKREMLDHQWVDERGKLLGLEEEAEMDYEYLRGIANFLSLAARIAEEDAEIIVELYW